MPSRGKIQVFLEETLRNHPLPMRQGVLPYKIFVKDLQSWQPAQSSIRKIVTDPIIHCGHYRWPNWIRRMRQAGLVRSMSKKGRSPDNSACEGFFARLKNEMFYGRSWKGISLPEFIRGVDDYMRWYNEDRIKLSLVLRILPLTGRSQALAFRSKKLSASPQN